MKKGQLIFNVETNRYDLVSNGEILVDGYHCGDSVDVLINGSWFPTRFEYNDDGWYLVGLSGIVLNGLTARSSCR